MVKGSSILSSDVMGSMSRTVTRWLFNFVVVDDVNNLWAVARLMDDVVVLPSSVGVMRSSISGSSGGR